MYFQPSALLLFTIILNIFGQGDAIWCYRCTSATPGCGEDFNWRGIGYLGEPCPEDNDICVKVIEKKGADLTITRDCYSTFPGIRTDIPPDHYEGCRQNIPDVKLANYVNNTIKEYDLRRTYFEFTEYCFCFLDHRCNGAITIEYTSALKVFLMSISTFLAARILV